MARRPPFPLSPEPPHARRHTAARPGTDYAHQARCLAREARRQLERGHEDIDLTLVVLVQDAKAVADVIRRLRTTAHPGHAAYCCEAQLNALLGDALQQAGVHATDVAATMPTDTLAERMTLLLDTLYYPPETGHALATLVAGDIAPLRRLRGTPGLLARAVAAVGLCLVVWSPPKLQGLLHAERARCAHLAA
ncbi:hypothetical protein ACIRPK_36795 [Kitasatospora sp. NPDC101801]|uniref:hypothetical protein n=1 Tax=Kitasatospora sp. NPDC101801 TaxID=3364103 RepID=UPI00381EE56E